ncbi:MAG: tail fiber domain-containing protein [Bacteroidia bacterium]|nr:tail fiber domain-containing protein [Bacteroidia bacterium]
MKTKLPLTLLLSFSFYLLSSQVPQGFNYQAIARDGTSGNPITDPINVKIAILSDDDPEAIIREEQFTGVDPDEHGLFSLVVGQGSWVSGLTNFSDIDWTVTPKYIKTLIYYGGEWKDMGPAQLWSVPYAMYSPSTNPWSLNGSSLYFSGGNVGIGTATPAYKLEVNGDMLSSGSVIANSGTQTGLTIFKANNSTDQKFTELLSLGSEGNFIGRFVNDAYTDGQHWLNVARNTGTFTVSSVSFPNGNIGIGTVDPGAYKLNVNGGSVLINDGTGLSGTLKLAGHSYIGSADWGDLRLASGTNSGNTSIRFITENTERVFITGNGNVGIGVWPSQKLDVEGNIKANYLILDATDGVNEGGELYLAGAGSNPGMVIDNLSGNIRMHTFASGKYLQLIGGTLRSEGIGGYNYFAGNVGIGTETPSGRLAVGVPSNDWPDETPLFEVKNKYGVAVLAVYNNGVKINIEHDPDGIKGPKGGFNIGGYDYTKGGTYTLMNVTPDSIRFNINNGTSKGPKGGFAIGGFGVTKGDINEDFMYITPQSSNGGNYNAKMGFEAGKNSTGPHNTYMGVKAGKGVTGSTAASNIFIGEGSGMNNSGSYVSYLLLLPGGGTTTAFNSWGGENVAVGNYTGVGLYGTFLNQSYGQRNVLIGHYTGFNLTTGSKNVIIGNSAGLDLVSGNGNIFLGYNAGRDELGSNKLYIANSYTSAPLIYGDFDLDYAQINGDLYVAVEAYKPGGGEWVASSDIRLKNVLEPFKKGLTEVLGLNPVFYNYKEGNSRNLPSTNEYIGFVAQDVQQYIPEAVSTGKDGYLNLDMHVINVAMVNAIKEQQKLIEGQQKQIDRLEALVEKLMEHK